MIPSFTRLADLTDRESLKGLLGPVRAVERWPLERGGFSGSRLERLHVTLSHGDEQRFILKRIRPSFDWTAYRTGDRIGREAALPVEPRLRAIWDVFASPYRAVAVEDGMAGLLMDDVSDYVPADRQEPIARGDEEAALHALASLHARYWQSDALHIPWLAPFAARLNIIHPRAPAEEAARTPSYSLFERIRVGWDTALAHLPPASRALLLRPPEEIAQTAADLPATLLHGDPKLGNFAFLPHGRVTAFDWAVVGSGPATMDLGHYLAINGARLTRSREEVIDRYRSLLEGELEARLAGDAWEALLRAGLVGAATVLLWTKGLALHNRAPGAEADFAWWMERLQRYT